MTATTITVFAPGPYLSMNDRDHWRTHAARVKAWRTAGYLAARRDAPDWPCYTKLPPDCLHPPSVLSFVFEVPDKRRRDGMNVYPTVKALTDSLVDAGCWADDTPEFVTTTEPTYRVVARPRFRRRVDITITPRGAASGGDA